VRRGLTIVRELKGLGMVVSATTVRTWLRAAGPGPAGARGGMTWREFVRAHQRRILAVDFFMVETIWLQRLYVLLFIELGSRRVHIAGCTASPSAPWVTHPPRPGALQHLQLVPQGQHFELERGARTCPCAKGLEERDKDRHHRKSVSVDGRNINGRNKNGLFSKHSRHV